ncbi:MAG: hypothetical protein Q9177_004427, partial [Variospora cf. flavescens]
ASLPTYSDPEKSKSSISSGARDKQSSLADTPISPHEFSLAWTELCAFELDGQAYCPAPSVLWKVWISIASACTTNAWSLDQPLNTVLLAEVVADDEIPSPILYAVIDRLRANHGLAEQDHAMIDAATCASWTGVVRLQADPHESTLAINDFLSDWRDHLPESWRRYATLDMLKVRCLPTYRISDAKKQGSYILSPKDMIAFDDSERVIADSTPSTAHVKATGPQARRWHDKFKHSRRPQR